MTARLAIVRPDEPDTSPAPRSYADYLRGKGLEPLPSPHTKKRPGDLVLTGSGVYRVGGVR